MDYVTFTFDNLFDYQTITEDILSTECIKSIDNFQISIPYRILPNQRIKYMTNKCSPYNITFKVSLA